MSALFQSADKVEGWSELKQAATVNPPSPFPPSSCSAGQETCKTFVKLSHLALYYKKFSKTCLLSLLAVPTFARCQRNSHTICFKTSMSRNHLFSRMPNHPREKKLSSSYHIDHKLLTVCCSCGPSKGEEIEAALWLKEYSQQVYWILQVLYQLL